MKKTISENEFIRAFEQAGRKDQFSREALSAIFDYIEEYEDDSGEEIELDVISICCEWTEYDSAREAAEEYGWSEPTREDDEDGNEWLDRAEQEALEWLEDRTQVREVDGGGVVIVQF